MGGPDFDWSKTSYEYPNDFGKEWLENLQCHIDTDDKNLDIPEVDISNMNSDQRFAFNIVLKTIQNYLNEQDKFHFFKNDSLWNCWFGEILPYKMSC